MNIIDALKGFGYRTGTKPLMRYNWFLIIIIILLFIFTTSLIITMIDF